MQTVSYTHVGQAVQMDIYGAAAQRMRLPQKGNWVKIDSDNLGNFNPLVDNQFCRGVLGGFVGEEWLYFSPGGRFLLANTLAGPLRVWDLAGPKPVVTREQIAGVRGWAFHPDGSRLAVSRSDGTIVVEDLTGRQPPGRLRPGLVASHLAFHPSEPIDETVK